MGFPVALPLLLVIVCTPGGAAAGGCGGFRHLENGRTFFRYGGLLVMFRCRPGYRLHGFQTSSCVSGHWSRELPVCVGSGCSDPGPVVHGSSSVNQAGSWAEFSCVSGFGLRGPSMLFCKGHTWNGTKPVCKELDMMSSLSGVAAQTAASALKRAQQSHYPSVGRSPSEDPHLKSGSASSRAPSQTRSDGEGIKATHPKASPRDRGFHVRGASPREGARREAEDGICGADGKKMEAPLTSPAAPPTSSLPSPEFVAPPAVAVVQSPSSPPGLHTEEASVDPTSRHLSIPSSESPPTPPGSSSSSSSSSTIQSQIPNLTSPSHSTTTTSGAGPRHLPSPSTSGQFPRLGRRPVCPYPPVPARGTFHFRNVENPGPREFRHYIQYACYPGHTLAHGDVHSYCQQGGVWSGVTPVCLELTPCSVNNGGCSQLCSPSRHDNQSSDQNRVRAQCGCRPGFALLDDGRTCRDVDECADGQHRCQQRCINTFGSFKCGCDDGYRAAHDQTTCRHIDECPPGYRKEPRTPDNSATHTLQEEEEEGEEGEEGCVDINECVEQRCEWLCVNLPGSHRCICPRGYALHWDGQRCKDINECSRRNGGCSHLCVNQRGGHKCACPSSHRLSPSSWKKCVPRTTATTAG